MDAYLRPLVSRRLIPTIIKQRKKDIGEIEKYSQKNIYVRTAYNSFVCACTYMYVCVFLLIIFASYCVYDDTCAARQI